MRSLVEAEKRGEVCAAGESSRNPCETWVDFPDNCLDREDKTIADDPLTALGAPPRLRPGRPEQHALGPVPPPVVGAYPPSYVGVGDLLHGDDRIWGPPGTAE